MINSNDYKPKTSFRAHERKAPLTFFPIGLDIGYGSVKAISPLWQNIFPAYAVEVPELAPVLGAADDSYLTYEDLATGKKYYVGESAIWNLGNSTNISEDELFCRARYIQPSYRVLFDVAIGLSIRSNIYGSRGDRKIKIQMGLPPAWLEDQTLYSEILSGSHHFVLTQGSNRPEKFDLHFEKEDFDYISQPLGTLFSCALDSNAKPVPIGHDLMSSVVDIFDGGHNTLDNYIINKHIPSSGRTFDSLGMRQVYRNTMVRIKKELGVNCTYASLQEALTKGTVNYFNRLKLESHEYSFTGILEEESRKLCNEAIHKLNEISPLDKVRFLIITGGTGAAWADQIRETLSGLENISILMGNENEPDLPLTFANVRGYYYTLYHSLVSRAVA